MIVDFESLDGTQRYKVMASTITPRPIAWIVTVDNDIINIAPFSYFTPLSSNPATVVVSIGHKANGDKKDTLENILNTKKATICFVNQDLLDKMKLSAEPLAKEQSEAEIFDIKTEYIKDGYPPMVSDCECAIFCDFLQIVELNGSKTIPTILEVDSYYIDDKIVDDKMNIDLDNIGRVGRAFATHNIIK
jgi:flavin reductase (DIM6/NTAB) family NADH-FMN oxidoreductase RutF